MEIKGSVGFALCLLVGINLTAFSEDYFENTLWQDVKPLAEQYSRSSKSIKEMKEQATEVGLSSAYQNARYVSLDLEHMRALLSNRYGKTLAKKILTNKQRGLSKALTDNKMIELPLPDGEMIRVSIKENTLLPAELRKSFPHIKMLNIIPDDFIVSGKLDITMNGFHAMLQTRQGETLFIDPLGNNVYASYQKSSQKQSEDKVFSCGAYSEQKSQISLKSLASSLSATTKTKNRLINYRIAIAATGEYTAKHGGTVAGAMSAIATTINRVNQVFEQDLGIHLSLVEDNDKLIYVDANTDPYTESSSKELLYQNQNNIDAVIGSDNYDIGHLFSASGGGLATIGSVCNNARKAKGISGVSNPKNDSFNLDFVAHEIGHQFGATHTFNGVQGLCSGNTRSAITAFEPGSGSTIMSYAGYCGGDNLQSNTDAMFHIGSIQQIRTYVETRTNNKCGVTNNAHNASPKVNAGANYIIPAQTPFELEGDAIDGEGDNLIYSWQQVDAGALSPVNTDRGDNALFRTYPLSNKKSRTFPSLPSLLSHVRTRGENLPVQQRIMRFKLVVQDSHNTTQSDAMKILVRRTGSRFALNMPRSQYQIGETHKILWNVANTDKSPINCSSVDLSLSVDGGYHFDQTLGENLPNTGEAWVVIPSTTLSTSWGRFKISCSDNIFFAISYRNFDINDKKHSARTILADEDQHEASLDDVDLSKTTIIDELSEPNIVGGKAGGTLGWWVLFLLLLGFRRFIK